MTKKARRTWLKQASALGLIAPAGISSLIQDVLAKGDIPVVTGMNSLTGRATVNGVPAKVGTPVKPGDKVSTSNEKNSMAVVVIGKDAFLLRAGSTIVFEESKQQPGALDTVLITTGKLLSVFAKRPAGQGVTVRARSATIGIRGTGCYIEALPTRTYFCLCYGEATIDSPGMATRTVTAIHHDDPMWLDESSGVMKLEKTKFGSHTDDELIMLEKLTGREPPFVALGMTGVY
jgi:hypothetical protein